MRLEEPDCTRLCPDWGCRGARGYSGVWVVGEAGDGRLEESSLQLVTPAKTIASKIGAMVEGVLLGYDKSFLEYAAREMVYHGVERVRILYSEKLKPYTPEVYGSILAQMAERYRPSIILFSATMRGRELAPYVAGLLKTGIVADPAYIDVDTATGSLVAVKPLYTLEQNLYAYITTPSRRPGIATIRPNTFQAPARDETRRGDIVWEDESSYTIPRPRVKLLRVEKRVGEGALLEKADYIVAGGGGVGSREGFKMLEKLAEILGGTIAGTMKAVDLGLVEPERMVGETGRIVRAKLYIAVGISGAPQHVVGFKDSRVVVAVNKNPEAPIFNHADYGIVADWRDVIPLLVEELAKRREKGRG